MNRSDPSYWHLICGASRGIGYAVAESLASRGQNVILVGRDRADLARAKPKLRELGAKRVAIRTVDLLDAAARQRLVGSVRSFPLRSVLIGGPSPPAGPLSIVSAESLDRAYEICLRYPFDVVGALLARPPRTRPSIVMYISSSAVTVAVAHPHFYLSGLLRRTTERLLRDLVSGVEGHGCRLISFRPELVWTSLSERYAKSKFPDADPSLLRSLLAGDLHAKGAPDPNVFLNAALRKAGLNWDEVVA